MDEIPTLRRIADRYEDDVMLVGINMDSAADLPVDDLRRWVDSRDLQGLQLHDGQCWDSTLVEKFGVREIPFTVLVGPDGSVLAVNEHGKRLEKAVKAAVKGD
jgi:hypothetical protein